jgi:hypothetical protein
MNRAEVLKKLDGILSQYEQAKTFGCLEIEFRGGHVTLIRKTQTERIENEDRETTHAKTNFR